MPAAPQLPTRFPCWCRATYSWGGETKRDLGFIEGDLIECLNAGDGQWWMGRLRRDKRMMGLFPSNFVEVLDNYTPVSRQVSPMPIQSPAGSLNKTSPQKSKSVFRKPFQAYAKAGAPNPDAAAREIRKRESDGASPQNLTPPSSASKHKPYGSMKRGSTDSRAASPSPLRDTHTPTTMKSPTPLGKSNSYTRSHAGTPSRPAHGSQLRAKSPAPFSNRGTDYSRAASPAPLRHYQQQYSRAASPAPQPQQHSYSRAPSPAPPMPHNTYRAVSPAPPSQYQAYSRAASSAPPVQPYSYSRAASPIPPPQHQAYSRAASPAPFSTIRAHTPSYQDYDDVDETPPPAPPPHRVLNGASRAASPMPFQERPNGYHTPAPPSPRPGNLTPSPLTNAMNDVMSSLQDMGIQRESPPPEPPGVWSPQAFNQVHTTSRKARSHTALGIGAQEDDEEDYVHYPGGANSVAAADHRVDNYVQRMESRLRQLQAEDARSIKHTLYRNTATYDDEEQPPPPPSKGFSRPQSSLERGDSTTSLTRSLSKKLRNRKSAYELGREVLGRTFTTKSSATNSSSGVQSTTTQSTNSTNKTSASIMSAGAFSATSAGSMARKKWAIGGASRPTSVMETRRKFEEDRPESPFTGVTYHSSHASNTDEWQASTTGSNSGVLGGLTAPKRKKSGFLRKMVESAKTGAATARSAIAAGSTSRPVSRQSKMESIEGPFSNMSPSRPTSSAAKDMGMGGGSDWMQVRRDVNRSNSLSKNERLERVERCQMNDIPTFTPVESLLDTAEGDEGLDGLPIAEPTDFSNCNLALVDKSARFVTNLPHTLAAAVLAQGYVCRPYRSDVQRLRAIFTWVSERMAWEEDYEGAIDTRRVLQAKRGGSEEISVLVAEMCAAVGIHAEVVRGFLKMPGEHIDPDMSLRPNHHWNAVIVDGEWRIMDCSLAMPSNPKRGLFSSCSSQIAESGFFLARPLEICYTHVPVHPEQQHIVPPMDHAILMALPVACPPYFTNGLQLYDFDTSILYLENLEISQIQLTVPADVECVAEVEARMFSQDGDGDFFENGNVVRKRALAQAEWVGGQKRYTVKAVLPGDEGQGVLKVYAGKRGLMHSIKSIPHPLAFALPLTHTGLNPIFDFVTIHPTPHAQRHDLYIAQPQCARLALNNTFVFAVRQHPSSLTTSPDPSTSGFDANGRSISRAASPNPVNRPASAMSMLSTSQSGSQYSHPSNSSSSSSGIVGPNGQKPAKLAIQSPAGKIIRLLRKSEHMVGQGEAGDGGVWETVIKIGERGVWRGLVLADRSARWCVFAEWECA